MAILLSEATRDELMMELALRCSAGVIAVSYYEEGNKSRYTRSSWGEYTSQLGLVELAQRAVDESDPELDEDGDTAGFCVGRGSRDEEDGWFDEDEEETI